MTSVEASENLTRNWLQTVARFGYTAKGLVYLVIGFIAARAAFTVRGDYSGSEGAFATILAQPFGQLMLAIVAAGLAAYAVWRYMQAFFDIEARITGSKNPLQRAGALASGVFHTGLVLLALRMLGVYGDSTIAGDEGDAGDKALATLMSQPFGRYLVMLVGAVVVAVGIRQAHRAYTDSAEKRLDLSGFSEAMRIWFLRAASWALVARGIVFVTIGLLVIGAGWRTDPSEAAGTREAMRYLENQSFGPYVLAFVAIGLMFYGLFQLAQSRYRIIPRSP